VVGGALPDMSCLLQGVKKKSVCRQNDITESYIRKLDICTCDVVIQRMRTSENASTLKESCELPRQKGNAILGLCPLLDTEC
jgi:hypothetical protein